MVPTKRSTWSDYYLQYCAEDAGGKEAYNVAYSVFDKASTDYVESEGSFLSRVEENLVLNFVLMPTTAKGRLNILHNCFWDERAPGGAQMVGVHGARFSSTLGRPSRRTDW
jgi:hypothetical protein